MDCSPLLPSPLVVPNIFLTHPQLIWPLLPLPVHSVLLPLHLSGSLTGQTPVPSLFLPIPTIPLQLCRPSSGTELPCPSLPIPHPTLPRVYPTTPPTPLGPASYELTSTPFSFHYPHLPSPPANWPQPPLCPQLPIPLQLSSAMNWPQILLHPHLSDPPLSNCTDLVRTLCVLILRASLVAQGWSLCLQCRRPGFDPSQEDPLEQEMATHSSTLAWKILWATIHGVAKSQTWLSNFTFTILWDNMLLATLPSSKKFWLYFI